MVVSSSGFGEFATPGMLSYSASKTFSSFVAQALHYEVKDKIDVLSWLPGHVDTKLPADHRSGCSNTISSYQAIEGMLRDLGKERKTFGHRNHWFGSATLEYAPMSVLGPKFV